MLKAIKANDLNEGQTFGHAGRIYRACTVEEVINHPAYAEEGVLAYTAVQGRNAPRGWTRTPVRFRADETVFVEEDDA